uniref:Peptidase S1 domain-containing protein n=1 Tax=Stegastes partitus TaxID=144197 RepID=A0A3B4ZG16_9TELE
MARLTLVLLLLGLGVAVSTVVDLQKRIIGGRKCGPLVRHYHVKVIGRNGKYRSFCGGSLISDEPPLLTHEFRLHVLKRIVIRAPFTFVLCYFCIGQRHGFTIGQTVWIAGHGATEPRESPTLQCATIDVVDCNNLRNTLQNIFPNIYPVKIYQHWFCGQRAGVDICRGDSGGGVVTQNKIYGVISFLGDPDYVCRRAAAFMDVCNQNYLKWIKDTIKKPNKKCGLNCG